MAEAFEDIVEHARQLQAGMANRNTFYDEVDNAYLMEDVSVSSMPSMKKTISPDARNSIQGATRLMTAAEPEFKVPNESSGKNAIKMGSQIEKLCTSTWRVANRVKKKRVEREAILSGLLYDEIHITVASTEDLLSRATDDNRDALEEIAKRTPLLFDVIPPRVAFPEFDQYGLASHLVTHELTVRDVKSRWGTNALDALGERKPNEIVTFNEYWNRKQHCVWIDGSDTPIFMADHKLPFIPISCQIIEGSDLFAFNDRQTRQPMLYTLIKSGMWERQNLSLTILYTMIFGFANPMWVYTSNDPDKAAPIRDYSVPGGMIRLEVGEKYEPLSKAVIDPALLEGLNIANEKVTESTIYKQALGQALGSGEAFSTVALLSQAGRLPLVPVKVAAGWAIADAVYLGLRLLKVTKQKMKYNDENQVVEIKAKDLPDSFDLEANLEIKLPQDERQNMAMAVQATAGENPVLSMRAARENLGYGQSDVMTEEIWSERFSSLRANEMFQKEIKAMQMRLQQAQAQANQQGQPGGQMPQGTLPPQAASGQEQPMSPEEVGGGQMPPEIQAEAQGQGPMPPQASEGLPGMPMSGPMEQGWMM